MQLERSQTLQNAWYTVQRKALEVSGRTLFASAQSRDWIAAEESEWKKRGRKKLIVINKFVFTARYGIVRRYELWLKPKQLEKE